MKMTNTKKTAIALALLIMAGTVHSQSNVPQRTTKDSETALPTVDSGVTENTTNNSAAKAQAWGITEQEMARYEEITKQGGIYSSLGKDLTALEVLGMEARSDTERQYYARKMIEQETRYQKNLLAFEAAKMDQLKKQYPHLDMWYSQEQLRQRSLPELLQGLATHLDKRLVIYVSANSCDSECMDYITKVRESASLSTRVDIFFTNTKGSDKKLREAVNNLGISSDEIDGVNLTVNHDEGYFAQMKVDGVKSLPLAVKIDKETGQPTQIKNW